MHCLRVEQGVTALLVVNSGDAVPVQKIISHRLAKGGKHCGEHLQQAPLQTQRHRRLRVDNDPTRPGHIHIKYSLPIESSSNGARAERCNEPGMESSALKRAQVHGVVLDLPDRCDAVLAGCQDYCEAQG